MGILSGLYGKFGFDILTVEFKGWIIFDCIKPP